MSGRVMSMLRRGLSSKGTAAFLIAALVVGVLVGLAAAALVGAIEGVRWLTGGKSEDVSILLPLVAVPVGLVIADAIARRFGPGVSGGGVTETMVGLSLRAGYLPTRTIAAKIAATAATLGSGGSAGREGPVVQVGATIGSSFGRYTQFGEDQVRSLVAAGAAAGIGASFNAPIAGMLFAMEVLLGNFAIRHLNAVVVASVAAAVTARSIVGADRILSSPVHQLNDPRELLLYALLGVAAVVFAVGFLRTLDATVQLSERFNAPRWALPAVGGLAIGAAGLIDADVLGAGQEWVAGLLALATDSDRFWPALLLLAAVKAATTSVTRAAGGSGGTFMPSLYIGAGLGASLALALDGVWTFSELDPGAFAIVGMAATFAAVARAPLTAIIMVFEITNTYELVLPLMLAASLATFLSERIERDGVYTLPLRRRGIHLPRREDIDLLDTVLVRDVMSEPYGSLGPDMTVAQAEAELDRSRHHGMPVVEDDRLVGMFTVRDLAKAVQPDDRVGDLMSQPVITTTAQMPVSAALARMASIGVGRLPVVDEMNAGRLIGMFRRESVVRAYHHALGTATDRSLYRERLKARIQPGASFFELPVPARSAAAGRLIRELEWPQDGTLVSVRRGGSVLIPHGDTMIQAGDTITAFGSGEARVEFAFLLEPGLESNSPAGDEQAAP